MVLEFEHLGLELIPSLQIVCPLAQPLQAPVGSHVTQG